MARPLLYSAIAAGLLLAPALPSAAAAQGKLDARYTASLAGVPLGKGAWVIDVADDQYTAALSGLTVGMLRVFASGNGTSAVRGLFANGILMPLAYAATIIADKRSEEIRFSFSGNAVTDLVVEPPAPPNPDRVPVTDAHRRNVVDPMTASIMRVPGNGNPISAESCTRSASVFDGRMRYDLTLAFKRIDQVKAEKGYAGPGLVCSIYFRPVAGYIPARSTIKYLIAQRDMEVTLAPIAGTRVLVPYRIMLPTPLGTGALQATQFVTEAKPRLTPTSTSGQ